MFKFLKKRKKKDNKGFTLVELVIVIAILAILVGLLAPQYTKYVEKARKSSDASNLENMVKAVEVAIADTDENVRVKAGTYKITIMASATNAKTTTVTLTDGGTGATVKTAEDAISEVIGKDWADTKLKSQNWGETGISATIKVESTGAFSVTYAPKALADMTQTTVTP